MASYIFQRVGKNKGTIYCQVKPKCGMFRNAFLGETLVLLVLLLFASSKAIPQEIASSVILPIGYNSMIRPGNQIEGNGHTLNVSISMYINDLVDSTDNEQTITLDLILVQQWYDRRLNVSSIGPDQAVTFARSSTIRQFWLPHLYFVNGLDASVVSAMQNVEKLTITGEGLLSFAQRINAHLDCPMNLQNFPHDIQYCPVTISTLIYNQSEIALVWKEFEAPTGNYPIFKIKYSWTAVCEEWRNPIQGNPCIYANLKLVRRLPFYIIRIYLLSFLTVAISIVNFWVPINAWPARITLLVMPILNLITQDITVNNSIGVYYVTSFHWWMMWIQGIVYLEIIEYAVAISWSHFVADKTHFRKLLAEAKAAEERGDPPPDPPVPILMEGYYFGNKGWYYRIGLFFDKFNYFFFGYIDYQLDPYSRNKVDYTARVVFPVLFVFFTFLYITITFIYWSANYYVY